MLVRRFALPITAAAALVVGGSLAGCSKSNDVATSSTQAPTTQASGSASGYGSPSTTAKAAGSGTTTGSAGASSSGSGSASIKTASSSLGEIVVDSEGRTLYLFEKDTGPTSTCTGSCATAWPAATVTGTPTAGTGLDSAKLTTTMRDDGTTQLVYNGHPLYRYAMDAKAGDTQGQEVGEIWYVVSPSGEKIGT